MMLHIVVENFTDYPSKESAAKLANHLIKYPELVSQVSAYNRAWAFSYLKTGAL